MRNKRRHDSSSFYVLTKFFSIFNLIFFLYYVLTCFFFCALPKPTHLSFTLYSNNNINILKVLILKKGKDTNPIDWNCLQRVSQTKAVALVYAVNMIQLYLMREGDLSATTTRRTDDKEVVVGCY